MFGPGFIRTILEGQDNVSDHRAADGNIHVSALSELCPRRHVLVLRDGIHKDKTPRSVDRVVWAIGRGIENHVRSQLIAALNFHGVVGKWACPCGTLVYEGAHNATRLCERCRIAARVYGELSVIDGASGIEGNPDFLFFHSRRLLPLEIKSMNKADFNALDAPVPNHVFQLGCYHRLLTLRREVPIAPVGVILYVSKDYDFRTYPYKEFHVNFVQEQWLQSSLDEGWRKANETQAALRSAELPRRLAACTNPNAPMAKNCVACVNCFSRP